MIELPKYHETFIPILKVLSNKKVIHHSDLKVRVRDEFYSDLPQALLSHKTSSGENTLLNRISWGKSYLKQGKFVDYPERGMVQITEKGISLINNQRTFTLEELKNDKDFVAYKRLKKVEKGISIDETNSDGATPQDLIDSGFHLIEGQIRTEILDKLKTVNPYYFEKIILILLKKMGYGDFVETPKSGDGGIDGIINQDPLGVEKIYIQAKRFSENKVREKDIRNFIGAMSGDTSKGVFVTTSTFDEGAIQKARDARHTIVLIDGEKIAELMYEYKVGVQVQSHYEIREVDYDFFEED